MYNEQGSLVADYMNALINLNYDSTHYEKIVQKHHKNAQELFFEAHISLVKNLIISKNYYDKIFKIFLNKEKTHNVSFIVNETYVDFISINDKDIKEGKKMSIEFLLNSLNNPNTLFSNILAILSSYNPSPE
jgi:hypothetical protein